MRKEKPVDVLGPESALLAYGESRTRALCRLRAQCALLSTPIASGSCAFYANCPEVIKGSLPGVGVAGPGEVRRPGDRRSGAGVGRICLVSGMHTTNAGSRRFCGW